MDSNEILEKQYMDNEGLAVLVQITSKYVLEQIANVNKTGVFCLDSSEYQNVSKKTLRDSLNNIFYPVTDTDAVYNSEGVLLSTVLENINTDISNIKKEYLKLNGGTMTGGITMSTGNTASNDLGILFGAVSKIGANTDGALGIYASDNIYIRPGSGEINTKEGIIISTTALYPSNTMDLGRPSNKWSSVYSTTFYGDLSGNATSATKATQDGDGKVITDTYATKVESEAQVVSNTITGTNPTITNSTAASAICMNNAGYIRQKTLRGDNLFEVDTSSWILTNNGIKNRAKNVGVLLGSVKLLAGKTYTISCNVLTKPTTNTTFTAYVNDIEDDSYSFLNLASFSVNVKAMHTITPSEDIDLFYRMWGNDNADIFEFQLWCNEGEAKEYELYCGAVQSPNIDYPQHIDGLGDKGYFDGHLLQGYYNYGVGDIASFVSSEKVVCNKNIILCKDGDSVKLKYENSAKLRIVFIDENMKSLESQSINGAQITAIAPAQTKYLLFNIEEIDITPSTAKHTCVTINGQYAMRVKTENKNIVLRTDINPYKHIWNHSLNCELNLIPNTYYAVSFDSDNEGNTYLFNGDLFSIAPYLNIVKGRNSALVKTKDNITSNYVTILKNSKEEPNTPQFDNLQIEEGAVATPFVEHQETEALIPVSSPFYDGDYFEVYADGSGKIVRVNYKQYITEVGNDWCVENPEIYSNDSYYFAILLKYKSDNNKGSYSNRLQLQDGDLLWNDVTVNGYGISSDGTNVRIRLTGVLSEYTKAGANEYLSNNLSYIIYRLETPIVEPLTAEQVAEFKKLCTFDEVTHVNADGTISIRYYCNTDSGKTVAMLQKMIQAGTNY